MLYFRDKIRAETWENAKYLQPGSYYSISSFKRCTSSDVENKSFLKVRANADVGTGKF